VKWLPACDDKNIPGLDIPMDNAFRVSGIKAVGNLDRQIENFIHA